MTTLALLLTVLFDLSASQVQPAAANEFTPRSFDEIIASKEACHMFFSVTLFDMQMDTSYLWDSDTPWSRSR
ncbi:MAG: hypothetical protein HY549_08650 [Elusimicrobia bacterium]|nr:hypothetical protein [Elusimicrobiota bacterium]